MLRTALSFRCLTLVALLQAVCVTACAKELTEAPAFVPPQLIEPDRANTLDEESSILVDEGPAQELREQLAEPFPTEADTLSSGASELIETIRSTHPWARFEPGAWRRVLVVSEVFDEEGAFAGRSLNERTERLTAVDDTTYTLSIESVVELGGLRTPAPAQLRKFSILTDREPFADATTTASLGEPSSISLGKTVVSCRTWILEATTPAGSETETLHLASEKTPALLRRERQAMVDGEPGVRLTKSVTRLDSPALYGDELSATWHVVASTTHPSGARSEVFSIHGNDAPGGVYREATTEYDASGRKTRWAVTQLVASGRTAAESIGTMAQSEKNPAASVEVRPRQFLRLLRREERRQRAEQAR